MQLLSLPATIVLKQNEILQQHRHKAADIGFIAGKWFRNEAELLEHLRRLGKFHLRVYG